MRILILLPLLLAAVAAAARAADNSNAPFRPQPRVLMDPPAWYSPAHFKLMGKPQSGEWMAAHPEPPQSFQNYAALKPNLPTQERHTLHLSAVGPIAATDRERLATLREFLELYYALPVRMGPDLGLKDVTSRDREMFGRTVRQYLTEDILHQVLMPAVPRDAYCLQGVTMEDLYPEPSWNYVFGQAMLTHRVGIYSLVRFYPAFWGRKDDDASRKRGLLRSLQTLVHETGHMFGVAHCQKYECVMNGSNSLQESDRRPIHLCPECLRKFRWNTGFNIVKRYEALKAFYEKQALTSQAEWIELRLRECRGAAGTAPAKPAGTGGAQETKGTDSKLPSP
jgi:archaemetzincin